MTILKAMVDSPEGIAYIVKWAKAHGFVLNPHHREIATKYGVDVEGVIFNDPIPIQSVTP